MKRSDEARIERLLREDLLPEPPAELLERLRREVPAQLSRPTLVAPVALRRQPAARSRSWLLAASLLTLVGGGLLAVWVVRVAPRWQAVATGEQELSAAAGAAPVSGPAAPVEHSQPAPLRAEREEAGSEPEARAAQAPEDLSVVTSEELEKTPTSRDPSAVLQRAPDARADRISAGAGERERLQTAGREDAPPPPPQPEPGPAPAERPLPSPAERPLRAPAPSTGGTAEPHDQPYGDVFFDSWGINPFVDTEDDPRSTFGLEVDTGSWGVVRRYLGDGHLPPAAAVRVEELVNAFRYGDPPPRRGGFALRAQGAPSPWAPGERRHLLRLAVTAREVTRAERRPADLAFVVDVSGSMAGEDRLGLVRRSLELLIGQLGPRDRVGLVVYGGRGEVLLPLSGDRERLRAAIGRLVPAGATNAEEGLVLGYRMLEQSGRPGAARRVILCSDGVANVGRTGAGSILERIGDAARQGIELTAVGFGMGNYNDVLMEQLADRGDGRYAYVDTLAEARRLFVEELTGTLETVAAEARAQLELDPRLVARYRLLGYENRDIPDPRFRDDRVDGGEIGAGHTVTALYELELRPGVEPRQGDPRPLGTLRVRYRPVGGAEGIAREDDYGPLRRQRRPDGFVEAELPIPLATLHGSWEEAPRELRLATVVARFAEALRDSPWARGDDLEELFRRAQRLVAEHPGDSRVAELAHLVGRARDLRRAAAEGRPDDGPNDGP
ncbi:MAG TPA: von Willebrand factor type A domain-containing protein [Thermoanaerobaculia bacterium]|nr:von Willebrand factor type A domain-containing protein [Thermoanaerobaculia bacterium]